MRVLIVDDSKVMRMIIVRTLRQAELGAIDVAEASDGQEGLEFLRALRATGNTTSFGFITSETHQSIKDEGLAAGADFLLTKPFSPEQFAAIVGAVV